MLSSLPFQVYNRHIPFRSSFSKAHGSCCFFKPTVRFLRFDRLATGLNQSPTQKCFLQDVSWVTEVGVSTVSSGSEWLKPALAFRLQEDSLGLHGPELSTWPSCLLMEKEQVY